MCECVSVDLRSRTHSTLTPRDGATTALPRPWDRRRRSRLAHVGLCVRRRREVACVPKARANSACNAAHSDTRRSCGCRKSATVWPRCSGYRRGSWPLRLPRNASRSQYFRLRRGYFSVRDTMGAPSSAAALCGIRGHPRCMRVVPKEEPVLGTCSQCMRWSGDGDVEAYSKSPNGPQRSSRETRSTISRCSGLMGVGLRFCQGGPGGRRLRTARDAPSQ